MRLSLLSPRFMPAVLAVAFTVSVAAAQAVTPISEVQGSGLETPLDMQTVTVEAVVTADFTGFDRLEGFYIQEETVDQDDDPATSEGLFVRARRADVQPGDLVRVTGTASEAYGQTVLLRPQIEVLASNVPLPPAARVSLPVDAVEDWERFEGMRVRVDGPLTANDLYNLGRYGEVLLSSGGRLRTPTDVAAPGAPALEVEAENALRSLVLDDGRNTQNPVPVPHGVTPEAVPRSGDTLNAVTGILAYGFDRYRLHPTAPVTFNRSNPRPNVPALDGDVRIVTLNVHNHFVTLDDAGAGCGPESELDCRGADSEAEFALQTAKLVSALRALKPDVVALVETENDEGQAAEALADALSEVSGVTYRTVPGGPYGTDAIRQAFLYNPDVVALQGEAHTLDETADPRFLSSKNRPAVAQAFTHRVSSEAFVVVANHLKSKGSSCTGVGDRDQGDGQGNCSGVRTDAARAIVDWLPDAFGADLADRALVTGDLNAYRMEDPVRVFLDAGYADLLPADGHTYVFFGRAGRLDHALAAPGLAPHAKAAVWHVNSDEARLLDYNEEYDPPAYKQPGPYRSSDHDPILTVLTFN